MADSSIAVEALDTARSIANDRSAARCCRRSPLLWPAATLTEPSTSLALSPTTGGAQALASIATTVAGGEADRALDIARAPPDNWWRAQALESIAGAMAGTDSDRALDIARAITDDWWRAGVGVDATTLADGSIADEALGLAGTITNKAVLLEALALIACTLTAGDPDRALDIARAIAHDEFRARALASIANTLADSTIADEALDAAGALPDDGSRGQAFASIAATVAGSDPDRALDIAGTITSENDGLNTADVPWPPPPAPARCDRSTVPSAAQAFSGWS